MTCMCIYIYMRIYIHIYIYILFDRLTNHKLAAIRHLFCLSHEHNSKGENECMYREMIKQQDSMDPDISSAGSKHVSFGSIVYSLDRDFTIYFMVNMQKTVERLKDLQFFNGKLMISLAMFHRMPKV